MKLVLDTNLYVKAFRDRTAAMELERFYAAFTPNTYLSSIVLHELLVGASTPGKARQIREDLLGPLIRVGRLVTPTHAAWNRAGSAIAAMARAEPRDRRSIPKSLVNDFLLAASCRESGATLVTDNTGDFRMIQTYLAHDHIAAWPGRP